MRLLQPPMTRRCGTAVDIDVEYIDTIETYLLDAITRDGRAWIALNVSAMSPRDHAGRLICEPHEFGFVFEEATADGLLVC